MKALVIAGGTGVPLELLQDELASAKLIICADSGAMHLALAGRLPDVLVGDMDSIDAGLLARLEASSVEIIRVKAEKDETDAWLAMDEAIARGATEIVLLGMTGGRIDHTLGNMMLLLRAANIGINAVIKDGECEIFVATGAAKISGWAGETVSILPVGAGVSVRYLDGLRYGTMEPLPLPIDSPVGVSNELTSDIAHIVVIGLAYVIRNTKEV